MRQVNKSLFSFSLYLLVTSNQVFASGAKLPDIANVLPDGTVPVTSKAPIPSAIPNTNNPPLISQTPNRGGPYIDQITNLSAQSDCAKTTWANRGRAPAGYIKGVSLSFARSLCRFKSQSTLSKILSAPSSGNTSKDALAVYQSTFSSLPINVSVSGEPNIRALYVLGMGLGMRESSGSYCEGWDRSAGSNRPSSAAEAGAFQTSYDSMSSSPELRKLYNDYIASPNRCYQNVFKEGVKCSTLNILGTGEGADYQKFNISCPAFATEYAMTMLRIQRSHYGPINRKEAQVIQSCNILLKSVEDLVDNDPYACQDLD